MRKLLPGIFQILHEKPPKAISMYYFENLKIFISLSFFPRKKKTFLFLLCVYRKWVLEEARRGC